MILGIDISNNNGSIHWPSVAHSGREFAIVKATEGTSFQDSYLEQNLSGLRSVGMAEGCYHFARPNLHTPEAEAAWFCSVVIPLMRPGTVLALDLEEYQDSLSGCPDVPGWALRWLRMVEQRCGFKPWLYTSPSVISQYDLRREPDLSDYGLWLASWGLGHIPAPPYPWDLTACWQSGVSGPGEVPGVQGQCDLDVFNGSRAQFEMYGMPGAAVPPADPPASDDPPPDTGGEPGVDVEALRAGLAALRASVDGLLAMIR